MDSGQYHQRPMHGLSMSFQYSDDPDSSFRQSTSSHLMPSCDGLPRSQPQPQSSQNFKTNNSGVSVSSSSNLLGSNFNLGPQMPLSMPPSGPDWLDTSQHNPSFDDQNANNYYDYSTLPNGNDNNSSTWLRDMDPGIPRWMPENIRLFNDPTNMPLNDFDHQMYMMDPSKQHELQNNMNHNHALFPSLEEAPREHFARLSLSHSPLSLPKIEDDGFLPSNDGLPYDKTPSFLPSNESSEDGGGGVSSREMTAVEMDEHGAEEPYAKLIYRALMSAPGHSMVLQEIYQWFRDNTTKGAADGKGWMNSIRHNLSMNAAFKKTERKLQGDDPKKSTEWVLEPFAIKDGVQSTTRYRKSTSSKKLPRTAGEYGLGLGSQRQASGRKGSTMCKSKLTRQRTREGRNNFDPRTGGGVRSTSHSHSQIDSVRRAQFERHSNNGRKQRSPLTPPAGEMASPAPYFSTSAAFPKVEQEVDMPFEDRYTFEECQGVYLGGGNDDGPIFSSNAHGHGHEGNSGSFHHAHAAATTASAGGRSGGSAMSNSRF